MDLGLYPVRGHGGHWGRGRGRGEGWEAWALRTVAMSNHLALGKTMGDMVKHLDIIEHVFPEQVLDYWGSQSVGISQGYDLAFSQNPALGLELRWRIGGSQSSRSWGALNWCPGLGQESVHVFAQHLVGRPGVP